MRYDNLIGLASSDEGEDDIVDDVPRRRRNGPKLRKNIYTPRLIGALDKCGVTNRRAIHIVSATIAALDLNIRDYVLSRCTLDNYRKKIRKQIASSFVRNSGVLADFNFFK